ncbi:DUF2169 family type VI secretion system accessory protein [Polyangium spumosum]|nr:DUF2169 domain-containing protein [Polyangium spumosum]
MTKPMAAPSPATRQVSTQNEEDQFELVVLAKRTYSITSAGRCVPADAQLPLVEEPRDEPDAPDLLAHDSDLWPIKRFTDVVVRGHAHAPRAASTFEAAIAVGRVERKVLVVGDRRASLSIRGRLVFSPPAPVESVPLRYDRAYGGRDRVAEEKWGNPFALFRAYFQSPASADQASPYVYPRNAAGRGYLMEPTREAVDALVLPNLEDPTDPLTPERIVVGSPTRWHLMPLPRSFGFVHPGWFPRVGYLGFIAPYDSVGVPFQEVARGEALSEATRGLLLPPRYSVRFFNGASLGLQLPFVSPGERCVLTNLMKGAPSFAFDLPRERPKLWADGRNGKLVETDPVIYTLVIEPDERRLTVLWRGAARAPRRYADEELAKMPFLVEW